MAKKITKTHDKDRPINESVQQLIEQDVKKLKELL